jgi:hypothetical protein
LVRCDQRRDLFRQGLLCQVDEYHIHASKTTRLANVVSPWNLFTAADEQCKQDEAAASTITVKPPNGQWIGSHESIGDLKSALPRKDGVLPKSY